MLDGILDIISKVECALRNHRRTDIDGLVYCDLCKTILAEPKTFTWRSTIIKETIINQGFLTYK
jgi:hypothetical protein